MQYQPHSHHTDAIHFTGSNAEAVATFVGRSCYKYHLHVTTEAVVEINPEKVADSNASDFGSDYGLPRRLDLWLTPDGSRLSSRPEKEQRELQRSTVPPEISLLEGQVLFRNEDNDWEVIDRHTFHRWFRPVTTGLPKQREDGTTAWFPNDEESLPEEESNPIQEAEQRAKEEASLESLKIHISLDEDDKEDEEDEHSALDDEEAESAMEEVQRFSRESVGKALPVEPVEPITNDNKEAYETNKTDRALEIGCNELMQQPVELRRSHPVADQLEPLLSPDSKVEDIVPFAAPLPGAEWECIRPGSSHEFYGQLVNIHDLIYAPKWNKASSQYDVTFSDVAYDRHKHQPLSVFMNRYAPHHQKDLIQAIERYVTIQRAGLQMKEDDYEQSKPYADYYQQHHHADFIPIWSQNLHAHILKDTQAQSNLDRGTGRPLLEALSRAAAWALPVTKQLRGMHYDPPAILPELMPQAGQIWSCVQPTPNHPFRQLFKVVGATSTLSAADHHRQFHYRVHGRFVKEDWVNNDLDIGLIAQHEGYYELDYDFFLQHYAPKDEDLLHQAIRRHNTNQEGDSHE